MSSNSFLSSSSTSSSRLLLEDDVGGRGYFARYTSVGVVDACPATCWDLIGDPCTWLTSVSGVREVPKSRVVSGLFGEHQTFDVVQTTKVNLLGKDFHVPMKMRIHSNSFTRENRFECKKRNKLLSKTEGSFQVIPMGDTRRLRKALPGFGREHLEHLERFGGSNGLNGLMGGSSQKSIVVFKQALQPSMMPPKFARGMFKRHLGRSIDHVMRDLQAGARRETTQGGDWLSHRALLPALAVIGSFGSFIAEVTA